MTKISLLFFLVSLTALIAKGQISEGGLPYFYNSQNRSKSLEIVNLPGIEKIADLDEKISYVKGESFQFAELFDVHLNMENSGQWIELDNGDKIWQISFKSEGAYSLNVTFSNYLLPEGARVFIYNASRTMVTGAYTYKNNKPWRGLSTMPVAGDEIIIEYYEPADAAFPGELTIKTIGHDYLGIFGQKDGQFGASASCNIDINCPTGDNWQTEKRAVCRMITNGSQLCSGSLINNALLDQTPYVLTANHCIFNDYLAQNTVFVFNYESLDCNGVDGSVAQSVSGAELIATKNKNVGYLDFSLLKLNEKIPLEYQPYFAGWDSRDIIPESGTCIHHPWGDVKKISVDNNAPEKATYLGYGYDPQVHWKILEWNAGTTQGGSSGSPLFNKDKRIVGCLSGGDADCTNPVDDYYQMFSVAYDKYQADSTQLKRWLDPNNSGILMMDGFDPSKTGGEVEDIISVSHWVKDQYLTGYFIPNGGGYLAGNNVYQDKAKAEFFNKNEFYPLNVVTGALVGFGVAKGRDNELIEMQVLKDDFGVPSTVLGSAFVTLGEIKIKADTTNNKKQEWVHFSFDPPVEVNSSIYLSIVLPQFPGDTVAIWTTVESPINTGWELNYNNQWYPYSDPLNSWGIKLSHVVSLEIGRYVSIESSNHILSSIELYPNPANDYITLSGLNNFTGKISMKDTFGRMVKELVVSNSNTVADWNISELKSGLYLIRIESKNHFYTKKFIKN